MNGMVKSIYYLKFILFLFSVDATFSTRIGKYINDSCKPNCRVKPVKCCNGTFICLFALTEIANGTEIRYSYGESGLPWRKVSVILLSMLIFLKNV